MSKEAILVTDGGTIAPPRALVSAWLETLPVATRAP